MSSAFVFLRPFILATVLYALLILAMAGSLVAALDSAAPGRMLAGLENDAFLNLWILSWGAHALATAPGSLFHANIFYPEPFTLAYSDHQLGLVPLFAALKALTGSAVVALNVLYLASFVLTGLTTFALARYFGLGSPAALVAGLAFAFAHPRLAHHFQTQLQTMWWLPLTLLLTERFLRRPTPARAALMAAAFAMQWLSSIYLGWFLTIALAVYLVSAIIAEPRIFRRRQLWLFGLPALGAALLVVVPTLLPYLVVARRWSHAWPLSQLSSNSSFPLGFLNVTPANLLYAPLLRPFGQGLGTEQQLFLGGAVLVLAVVGTVWGLRQPPALASGRRGLRWFTITCLALLLVSLFLSLGPRVGTSQASIPLPYVLLYEWVPGFAGMRSPGRFVFLAALALALLGGLGARALLDLVHRPALRHATAGALFVMVTVDVFTVLPAERLPAQDQEALLFLRETAFDGPIVELPVSWERDIPETHRMLGSMTHWRPLLTGYSGFRPPTDEVVAILQSAEPRIVADALQVMGIQTLVLHLDQLTPAERTRYSRADWTEAGFIENLRTARTAVWRLEQRGAPRGAEVVEADLNLPRQVAAGRTVEARLLLVTPDQTVRYDPIGGVQPVEAEWLPLDGGVAMRAQIPLALPRVIASKPQVKVDFDLAVPLQPGRYRLEVRGDGFAATRTVTVSRGGSG